MKTLDNISNEILDKLVKKYKDKKGFRVLDERKKIQFGKPKNYFLFSNTRINSFNSDGFEFTFIWIDGGLWQYKYLNTECGNLNHWRDPIEVLKEHLNKEL